jgi:hypothetical protein
MDPERTTTMGEDESVVMERPFQSMNAVLSTRAKFRIWVKSWRGWSEVSEENIVAVVCLCERRGFGIGSCGLVVRGGVCWSGIWQPSGCLASSSSL